MSKKKKKKHLPKDLPEKFLERLEKLVGVSRMAEVRKTFVDKPTTFRVNTIKATKQEIKKTLEEVGFKIQPVSWYDDAFILRNKTKQELTALPMYEQGKIYIQSLASMVPPLVLDPKPGEKVLDLTAAPGSKVSQIAALMKKEGELVANDLNKIRFFRLKHNVEMLGLSDSSPYQGEVGRGSSASWTFILRQEDGSVLSEEYPEYFDKVLVDAPCSGEARFIEGVPKTYGYWSEHKIKQVAYRQHKLLMAAWQALKPGGALVYSTCTIAPEENEARIDKLLLRTPGESEVVPIHIEGLPTVKPVQEWKGRAYHPDVQHTLRILPTMDIEGFYVAKVRKIC